MNTENNQDEHVNILCIIHPNKFDGYLHVSILRGAVLNKPNRDWDTFIWIPVIKNIYAVSFEKSANVINNQIEYVGYLTESIHEEVRAYNLGSATLDEIFNTDGHYCILSIPRTYLQGL